MTSHHLRRIVAATALVTLGLTLPVPVAAAPPGSPAPSTRPVIRLTAQTTVVAPNGAFAVFLAIRDAPVGGDIAIDIYDRVDTPADLPRATINHDPQATFLPAVPLETDPVDRIQPTGFAIQLYTASDQRPPVPYSYRITEPGVYPVRIRLRNADADEVGSFTTALIRTPEPGQSTGQARVTLLPVVHAAPPADPAVRGGTDLADPKLVAALPGFLQAFAEHPSVPATFAVTPDTAARLASDTDIAEALRAEATSDQRTVLDAPYLHIDPGELVTTNQVDELSALRDLGRTTLADQVADPPTGTWLLPRPVDSEALPFLRQAGIERLVLPSRAFTGPLPDHPVTIAAGAASISVLPTDPALPADLAKAADPVQAAHQLLARLTLQAEQRPGLDVALTLDPQIDPATLGVLLDTFAYGTPSLSVVPLDDVFAEAVPAPAGVGLIDPQPAVSASYRVAVAETGADLASYRSMATGAAGSATAVDDQAFARGLAYSAAIDLPGSERVADLRAVQARARSRFAGVAIPDRDKVTLGSRRARFPLPITSTLPGPVKVLVELDANDRLEFPKQSIEVTLSSDRTVVSIPVRTRTSGDTPVLITVRSPDGRVILGEGRYTIRSTAVSGGGLILTIGAGAFLALWWGRHWLRARRGSSPRRARGLGGEPTV